MQKKREYTEFEEGIYWHDYEEEDNVKSDLKIQVVSPCEEGRIFIKKLTTSDNPQCLYDNNYDILFFDWGGMSLGNSMLEHFCNYILNHAGDNPGKFFVMVSSFTKEAMVDVKKDFGDKCPFNIFLSISDFKDWLDK